MATSGPLSVEEANELVVEHRGWAESIARSVARAWNMDWQLDGLDGAAMEALIFCSRRYDPERGVPFKGYARKRIHEASTEAARRSKGWRRGSSKSAAEHRAREVSAEMFDVFPALRSGRMPLMEDGGGSDDGATRGAIRNLLVGASVIAAKQCATDALPDEVADFKKMVTFVANLHVVHQEIMWKVYWEGASLRTVATEWDTDELNVIREHKVILSHLHKCLTKQSTVAPPKVRPGLKSVAMQRTREKAEGQFSVLIKGVE